MPSVPCVMGLLSPVGWTQRVGGREREWDSRLAVREGDRLLHSSSLLLPPAASNAQCNGGGGALPPFSMPHSSKSTFVLLMQVSNLQTQEKFLMGEITYSVLKKQTQKHGNGFKETALTEKHIELELRTEIFMPGSAGADLQYMVGLA